MVGFYAFLSGYSLSLISNMYMLGLYAFLPGYALAWMLYGLPGCYTVCFDLCLGTVWPECYMYVQIYTYIYIYMFAFYAILTGYGLDWM